MSQEEDRQEFTRIADELLIRLYTEGGKQMKPWEKQMRRLFIKNHLTPHKPVYREPGQNKIF